MPLGKMKKSNILDLSLDFFIMSKCICQTFEKNLFFALQMTWTIVVSGKTNQVLRLLLNRAHTEFFFKCLKYAF